MRKGSPKSIWIAFPLGLLGVVTACGSPDGASEEMFSRTVVHLDKAGSVVSSKTTLVSASEQRKAVDAALQARRAGTIKLGTQARAGISAEGVYYDSGCDASDMWLFDQANYAGNELCLYTNTYSSIQSASLSNWSRWVCGGFGCYQSTWSHAIRSWEGGYSDGWFGGQNDYRCSLTPWSTMGGYESTASSCTQRATTINFYLTMYY